MRITPLVGVFALTLACGYKPEFAIREKTEHFDFRVTSDPVRPIARTPIAYKVVIRDQDTGAPVQGADGLIFATHQQGAEAAGGLVRPPEAYDNLHEGKELGTYYATMNFILAGDWALAIRLRRDTTTDVYERIDWVQTVFVPETQTPGSARAKSDSTSTAPAVTPVTPGAAPAPSKAATP